MIDWCWHLMILGVHYSNLDISFKDVFDDPVGIFVWIKLKEQSRYSREEVSYILFFLSYEKKTKLFEKWFYPFISPFTIFTIHNLPVNW